MLQITPHRDITAVDGNCCRRKMPRRSSFMFYLIGMSIIFVWYVMAILDAKTSLRKRQGLPFEAYQDSYSHYPTKVQWTKEQPYKFKDSKTMEMHERKQKLQSWCKTFQERDHDSNIETTRTFFYSKTARFGVCKAPKTGCSFMAKFFFALEPKMSVVKAFTMDRYEVHSGAYEYDEDFIFKTLKKQKAFTAVVSRDPFTRLFSAYIDKVFLIGKLNKKFGLTLRSRLYATEEESCGYDISFQGFLDQVVAMAAHGEYDEHWLPVSNLCNPCHLQYDFICKTETLDSDLYHIVEQLNLSEERIEAIKNSIATEKENKNEVMSLIKTTMYDHRRFKSECPNVLDLMEKTWKSLQIRGYIHEASPFPRERFWTMKKGKLKVGKVNDEDLINIVYEEFLNRPLTPKQMTRQRHRSLVRAYRNIRPDTISKIQKVFEYDFFLFNYGLEPPGGTKH